MVEDPVRLSGWKAIGKFYGKDRSTVLRWAAATDFPVRRVPGKKGGSVYAFEHELADWLKKRNPSSDPGAVEDLGAAQKPAVGLSDSSRMRGAHARRTAAIRAAVFSIGCAALISVSALAIWRPAGRGVARLPSDAFLAGLYTQGRDDWATRTPAGLRKSIAELGVVATRDPGFVPAHTGLADAYLLSCEFDAMPPELAFAKARAEAEAALRIDGDNADVNRVLGFIDYWRLNDLQSARTHFLRSIGVAPDIAQTRLWYGNILMDNGEVAAGRGQLQTARMLDPGSVAIQTDYAWALWQSGASAEAVARLRALEARSPDLSSPSYFLAIIALGMGDVAGYLDHGRRWAALQSDAAASARVSAQTMAFRRGGAKAALNLIAATRLFSTDRTRDAILVSAGTASLARNRTQLLALLARAQARGQHWKPLRWQRGLFSGWDGDQEVTARLNQLFAPRAGAVSLASTA